MLSFKPVSLLVHGLLLALLAACVPVLTSFPEGVQTQLQGIKVDTIPDRSGQYLRLLLVKALNPEEKDATRYRLTIGLSKVETAMGIARDATTTRMRVAITLSYTLTDSRKGLVLKAGNLKGYGAYNYILNGFYGNTVSQEATEFEALDILSQRMVLELARYFSDEATRSPKPENAKPDNPKAS